MKRKSVLIAALSLVLAFTMLFTGCQSATPTAAPTTATEATAAPTVAETTVAPTPEPLPPYEIFWMCGSWSANQRGTPDVESEASKYVQSKINATVRLLWLDWGSYQAKRDLMLAANEKVDLCFTAGWCGYIQGLAKNQYMDIKDLIDKYAPQTKALLEKSPLWLGPQSHGHIYGIPVNKEAGQTWGFMYRKDITDKYNLDMNALVPKNDDPVKMVDEFEKVLKQIHQLEPGLTAAQSAALDQFYINSKWEIVAGQLDFIGVTYDENNKKFTVISALEQPEMMQAFQRTHKWYQDGLIQTDVLVDQEHNNTAQAQGTVFSAVFNLKPYKDAETNAMAAKPIVWQQIDFTKPRANSDTVTGTVWAVPSYAQDPARSVMFLELINTDPYLNNLVNFGIEGKDYVVTGKNRIDFPAGKDAQTVSYFPGCQWAVANQFLNYLWPSEKDDKWQKYAEFNAASTPSPLIGFSFDPTPVKNQIAAFDAIRTEYKDRIYYGVADPTVELPKYIDKLKLAGLTDVMAELQKQLDAWAASK